MKRILLLIFGVGLLLTPLYAVETQTFQGTSQPGALQGSAWFSGTQKVGGVLGTTAGSGSPTCYGIAGDYLEYGTGLATGYTSIDTTHTFTTSGYLHKLKFYQIAGTNTDTLHIKAKVFRINGTNYDYVGESQTYDSASTGTAASHTMTLETPIAVQSGDILGIQFTCTGAGGCAMDGIGAMGSEGTTKYILGDITSNTEQASWTTWATHVISFEGETCQ